MRIDLPTCGFKSCRYCFDGNCINKVEYDRCEYREYKDYLQVHGRWILEREPNGKPYCFHCSVCDSDYHYIGIVTASDYCPNCGSKMDEGNDDAID